MVCERHDVRTRDYKSLNVVPPKPSLECFKNRFCFLVHKSGTSCQNAVSANSFKVLYRKQYFLWISFGQDLSQFIPVIITRTQYSHIPYMTVWFLFCLCLCSSDILRFLLLFFFYLLQILTFLLSYYFTFFEAVFQPYIVIFFNFEEVPTYK